MSGKLTPPSQESYDNQEAWRDQQSVYGLLTGESQWGAPVSLTSYSDDATYAQTIDNQGAGGLHLNVPGIMTVTDTGVAAGVFNGGTVNATTLNVTGTSSLAAVNATGLVTLSRAGLALSVTNNALIGGTLTVNGNVALGDANADVHTVIGVTTFRNAANTATQALIDAGNNRVVVGSGTALGSDTTPNLQVVGRLYVAPETANDFALEIRRSSAATVGWDVGVTSTNDLVFKDLTGAETFRAGAVASTYQMIVTGQGRVTNGLVVNGTGLLVTAGGATVTGGIVLASSGSIDGNGGVAGQLRIGAVIVNDVSLSGSEVLRVTGTALISGTMTVNGEASAKIVQTAKCSGALTLTGALQDVAGCSVSLTPGEWVVTGIFDFNCIGTDTGNQLQGTLVTSGGTASVTTSGIARLQVPTATTIATVAACWRVQVTATTTAKLQALKTGGTGTSAAGTQSTITAAFVGKP